ncbi:muscarinic acetylcholine receptor M3-like [Rhopilema esculentum]|uniref:muscarinic acetylcholine receptor M3-like n=1 Tax=Rhopilema esculentum TaxID=499914 RepID=UPI0031E0FFEC|eukprot:gene11898-2458_t
MIFGILDRSKETVLKRICDFLLNVFIHQSQGQELPYSLSSTMTESLITSIVNCTSVEAPRVLSIFSATATTVLGPVIIIGNFLVVFSVYRDPNKDLRTAFNFFVVHLAIADLLVGLLVCPLSVATHIAEATGMVSKDLKTLRQSLHLSYFLSVSASLLNLAALCIDRVIAIRFPFMYRVDLSCWHHVISAVIIWLTAICVSFVYFQIGYERMAMIMAIISVLFTFIVMISTVCLLYVSVKNRGKDQSFNLARSADIAVIPLQRLKSRSSKELQDVKKDPSIEKQVCSEKYKDMTSQLGSDVRQVVVRGRETTQGVLMDSDEISRKLKACRSLGSQLDRKAQIHRLERHELKRVRSVDVLDSSAPKADQLTKERHPTQLEHTSVLLNQDFTVIKPENDVYSAVEIDFFDKIRSRKETFSDNNTQTVHDENRKRKEARRVKGEKRITEAKYKYGSVEEAHPKAEMQLGSFVSEDGERTGRLYRMFRKKSSNLADSLSQSVRMHFSVNNMHRKLVLTLLTMLSAFLVCFVPSCGMVIYLNTSGGECGLRHWMRDLSFLLAVANSAMNPFIYAWRLPSFRKAIKMIVCSKGRNQIRPRGCPDNVAVL